MKPGRDLDALIAEKVLGFTRLNDRIIEGPEDFFVIELSHEDYSDRSQVILLPSYSTDIAAAWEVVEKLQAFNPFWNSESFMEFILTPSLGADEKHGWACNFGDDNTWAYADTTPLAICLAALKAVGVEV